MKIEQARKKYGRLSIQIAENGRPIVVIRPQNPKLALAIAEVALAKQDSALFDRLPNEVGEYTFAGWMPKRRDDVPPMYIVDEAGWIIDELKPGDSFVCGCLKLTS